MQSLNGIFCRIIYMMCFLILGLSMSLAAVFDSPVTAASRAEISRSLAQMTNHEVVTGNFKQTKSIKKLNRDFVSTGTFWISKNLGIVWKTEKPFPSELKVDDLQITERTANGTVRTIATKDNPIFDEFSRVMKAVLFGNIAELEVNFKLFYEKSKSGFRVGLVPREAAMRKVIANIVMDVSSYLDKVVITDGDGNPVIYEFTNQKFSDVSADALNTP